jgi:hypothetical protein
MAVTELTLLLLLAIAVGGALVRWTPLPLPILLVVVGLAASFLPGLDAIQIDPSCSCCCSFRRSSLPTPGCCHVATSSAC